MILITGGSGSGKSEYAENRIRDFDQKIYLATMKPYGREAKMRIERHRELRKHKGFQSLECCEDFLSFVREQKTQFQDASLILECVSNLVANELYGDDGTMADPIMVEKRVEESIQLLDSSTKNFVVVTNEVTADINGYSEETILYQKLLGTINQELAKMASEVYEVVYGIPVRLK